jgi:type IV secretory pathway VirJ component
MPLRELIDVALVGALGFGRLPWTTRPPESAALVLGLALGAGAASPPPVLDSLAIRGRFQTVRVYGARGGPSAVVASGDGGWIHLGPYVAEFLASQGYLVIGFDSKAYLSSFTKGDTTLSKTDVPGDFEVLVGYASRESNDRPVVVGVSEGAALAVLAATGEGAKAKMAGVVALGLPQKAELGWRLRDSIIYVTKGVPKEPFFDTGEVVAKVAPLPMVAIHSTHDEFVPMDEVTRVMANAAEPKKLWVIEARDHRFSGNQQALNQRLLEAIAWIKTQRH